jgi:acetyl-CoA synthetase
MYEGAPTYPYPNRWWSMIEKYGINILYTAPTAIRGLMRFGDAWPNRHDLSSLRLLGSVGEPINPEAWRWYHEVIGKQRCPIMDTWWQTETGMFMITPLPATELKPGSATLPFPGMEADIYDEEGQPGRRRRRRLPGAQEALAGHAAHHLQRPRPLRQQYWSKFPGVYFTGDSARRDKDGYYWVIGRVDDVIKVSGYRLGTAEIESALVSHPAVAEAAAIGLPHEIKGNAIHAYVILKPGTSSSEGWWKSCAHVGHEMGQSPSRRRSPSCRRCPRRAAARSCAACSKPARRAARRRPIHTGRISP